MVSPTWAVVVVVVASLISAAAAVVLVVIMHHPNHYYHTPKPCLPGVVAESSPWTQPAGNSHQRAQRRMDPEGQRSGGGV